MKFLYGILLALAAVAWAQSTNKIDTVLQKSLQRNGRANIIVSMTDGTQDILDKFATMSFSDRGKRAQALHDALSSRASNSQRKILRYLSTPSVSKKFGFTQVQSFWISNQIAIQSANLEIINQLATMNEVFIIEEEAIVHLNEPTERRQTLEVPSKVEYNVAYVNAPETWAKGVTGKGIVVGVVDTGCNAQHEAIKPNFKGGNYSWFDATFILPPIPPIGEIVIPIRPSTPKDDNGHGTHCAGTAVGKKYIGVAPDAELICCKGLKADGSGTQSDLIECLQWMACPTDWNGNYKDCDQIPHIVSNSWGGQGNNAGFQEAVKGVIAAGIYILFAAGNSGPGCDSIGSPGEYLNVTTIGSTGRDNATSSFSSRGPTKDSAHIRKPDFVTPGDQVLSADSKNTTNYIRFSGTSMATPNAAGVVALALSQDNTLTINEINTLLQKTANKAITDLVGNCGNTTIDTTPNNNFGYGQLDALALYEAILARAPN